MTLRTVSSDRLVDGAKLEAIVTGGDGSLFLDNSGTYSNPANSAVASVNGQTGVVTLDTDDVPEGTNKYDKTVVLTQGANVTITGTYPNFTIASTGGGGGGGTVTDVTSANADISVANGTTTPTLTLNTGVTANKIVQLDASARLPAVDGSQLTNLPVPAGVVPYTGATTNVDLGTHDILANNIWTEATFSFTPAEILNSFSTPLTLVAAPGAGKAIIVQSVMLSLDYNTVAYNTNTNMKVAYGFGGAPVAAFGSFLANTADAVSFSNNIVFGVTINTGIQLYTDGGNPLSGDSPIKCKIWYKTITI